MYFSKFWDIVNTRQGLGIHEAYITDRDINKNNILGGVKG